MVKTIKRDSVKAARVKKVAKITGVTEKSVYRVLSGKQNNEIILSAYLDLVEGEECLVEAVRQLVPQKQL